MKKSNIAGSYDPRYYTLDRLNEVSLSNVRISLKQFMKDYDVTEYPIDCFKLVRKIQEAKLIHLEVLEEGRMSAAFRRRPSTEMITAFRYPKARNFWALPSR